MAPSAPGASAFAPEGAPSTFHPVCKGNKTVWQSRPILGIPRQGRWGSPSADVGRGAARIPHPDPAGAGTSFIFLRSSLFGGGDPLLFIYFLRAIFWPLPGLLCSKSPLFQNFLSFIRITARLCTGAPPGEPASRWQFLSDTQLPPDVSAPRPAPLGARFFSFVTLIAD